MMHNMRRSWQLSSRLSAAAAAAAAAAMATTGGVSRRAGVSDSLMCFNADPKVGVQLCKQDMRGKDVALVRAALCFVKFGWQAVQSGSGQPVQCFACSRQRLISTVQYSSWGRVPTSGASQRVTCL